MKLPCQRTMSGSFSVLIGLMMLVAGVSAVEFPVPPLRPVPIPEAVAGKDYVADELLIKFKETINEDMKADIYRRSSSTKLRRFDSIKVDHVKLSKNI